MGRKGKGKKGGGDKQVEGAAPAPAPEQQQPSTSGAAGDPPPATVHSESKGKEAETTTQPPGPDKKGRKPPLQQQATQEPAGRGQPQQKQQQAAGWRGQQQPQQARQEYVHQSAGHGPPQQARQEYVQQPAGRGPPQQKQQQAGAWGGQQQPQQFQTPQQQPQQVQRPQQQPQQPRKEHDQARGRGRSRGQVQSPQRQQVYSRPIGSDSSVASGSGPWKKPSQEVEKVTTALQTHSFQQTTALPAQESKQVHPPAEPIKWDLEIPQRKDLKRGGKAGIPIMVETNHVALSFKPKYDSVIHHDVMITPDRPKRLMRRVWDMFTSKYLPRVPIAFDDSRNAYTPEPLSKEETVGEVEVAEDENSKPKTYKVVVKHAATVNLHELFNYMNTGGRTAVPQEALQCIDIVLRNCSAMRFVKVGRSFFSPPRGQIVHLGDGLELWHGFFQSAIIGWKPFLNVDVAHKGFPIEQPVVSLIAEMSIDRNDYRDGEINWDKLSQIQAFLKGLKIQYEIPNQPATRRSYRVNGFKDVPSKAMFVLPNGNSMSVAEYFIKEKKYRLQFPNLPVLWVGPKDRNIYLPAELCKIMPGQVINRKLNEIQTSKMVRSAATSTDLRKRKIMDSLHLANFNADPVVSAFGLSVGNSFEKIEARLLKPPELQYKDQVILPAKGVWRATPFLEASKVNCWTIINLHRGTQDENINRFAKDLAVSARRMGINIGDARPPFPRMDRFDKKRFQEILLQWKAKSVNIVFVIIPDFPTNVYGQVKQTSELVVGCLTQCIKSRTLFRMNQSTLGNILLKVNAKLNGTNHTIASKYRPPCLRVPCMIMGADVTHPSPDQTDIPSVAAVTASCDPTAAFKYNFLWRLQPARQEIIVDLEEIVKEQLLFFYKSTGQKPQRIIFFRDGVSEGQFKEVMNMEVQAIRRACAKLSGEFRPPITFLVVQKRHHTRFFPQPNETDDKNNNVRAGTVVDTYITHPTDIEYYLVSHASIQGVARPTKYRVLWDDSEMSEDELEHLTYYLCHLFTRCTRSVSYPAPTYYAHLAAFRARVYLEGNHINLDRLEQEQQQREIKKKNL